MSSPHILIAGCGDLGIALGCRLAADGYQVSGLRRSAVALPAGMRLVQGDVTRPDTLHPLAALEPDILVYAVAADASSDDSYRAHYVDGLRNVLAALQSAPPRHVFFVSSTRVYGQDDGQWLDESAPAQPADFGGERLLEAESLLAGRAATVLRLSGIYGPGRERLLNLARQPQHWPAHNAWTNRIHRDDAAGFIARLIRGLSQGIRPASCYLVTDSCPAPQHDVLRWIASELRTEVNRASPAVEGGKRLGNARMLAAGYALQYPDYRAGYGALIRQQQSGSAGA